MNEDLYSEETRKFMSEEKKTSIKAEVFSWVKVIVSAIIIALLVEQKGMQLILWHLCLD